MARSGLRRIGSADRHARHDSCYGSDDRRHGNHARLIPAQPAQLEAVNPPAAGGELRRSSWPWLGGLALLCLAMFFDALVAPAQWVLGRVDTDLPFQFLPWREFGFRELAKRSEERRVGKEWRSRWSPDQ